MIRGRQALGPAVSAQAQTATTPEQAFAFVSALENHWQIDDRYLRLERLPVGGYGGRIRIRTPLGLARTAQTDLTTTVAPHLVGGTATVGARTRARVYWTIEPAAHGSHISLAADLLDVGPVDRLLLSLGGRWWLRRRFDRVLERLVLVLERGAAGEAAAPVRVA